MKHRSHSGIRAYERQTAPRFRATDIGLHEGAQRGRVDIRYFREINDKGWFGSGCPHRFLKQDDSFERDCAANAQNVLAGVGAAASFHIQFSCLHGGEFYLKRSMRAIMFLI